MSEQFWATILAALIPTVPAILALVRVTNIKKDVKATRDQVVNDHSTNMREENDQRHVENKKALRWLSKNMLEVLDKIDWLVRMATSNSGRIQALEDTDRLRASSRRELREREAPPSHIVQLTDIPGYEDRAPWENTEAPK